MASGKIAGHIIAFDKPSKAMNATLVKPDVKMADMENKTPKTAEIANALLWLMRRGIVAIPIR